MEDINKLPYFDEELKLIAYCPFCDADLNPVKAKIIEGKDDLNLVHIQCNRCKGYVLALILRTMTGLSSIGLITDLNYDDVLSFKDNQELKSDDVINLHKKLHKKNLVTEIINN